jgi:hypothetical protein
MPEMPNGITLRVQVLNPQSQPLGGSVDLQFKSQGSLVREVKAADSSRDIEVSGLAPGAYELTVTPEDVARPVSATVTISATSTQSTEVIVDKAALARVAAQGAGSVISGPAVTTVPPAPPTSPDPPVGIPTVQYSVQGNLLFDNGLPASTVTVRAYNIGFAGQDTLLGSAASDAQGRYSITFTLAATLTVNLQVRALSASNIAGVTGNEVTISLTKFKAQRSETLNLVVPASIRPLAPEFQRLSADMSAKIDGITRLGQAQENQTRRDFTLLNQSTNWDARLLALAASAAQQAPATGLGQDALYALYRLGLPTDPSLLAMVPAPVVQKALTKASSAGIVGMNADQIGAATTAFQNFSGKTRLGMVATGAVSNFNDLLGNTIADATQKSTFTDLFFQNPSAGVDLWAKAASLNIPKATVETLRLQGKFLYLTFNNGALAKALQDQVGSLDNVAKIVDKDYHISDTWKQTLTSMAGQGGTQALDKLIPAIYPGKTTADRLQAYAADMARKVRISFPTQVAARMIESKQLVVKEKTASSVTAFLRAAVPLGYNLGRTPLNAFLQSSGKSLPAMDADSTASLKTLHRLYQITPSTESLQAAMKLGFSSANEIASYKKDEFIAKYGWVFPPGEAGIIWHHAWTVSSVTFNFFSSAKQLDTAPPVYALSPAAGDRQNAKNAIVQQFPTMASLFGSLDFCQCEDCRSVLSPAAYFVDLLEFLRKSGQNAAGYTPLDVLIGKDSAVPGRRPDLGALPLTCENTNTAMPYIDLVNEILEYYIANSKLDAGAAYDTGDATTADLTAAPQHILPQVYDTTLKQAVYPLGLPFDLWIETVRGFLNYFKIPLAQVLDTLRPTDTLELFTDANAYPYYHAQILAESLGLSPAEYQVLTVTDPGTLKPSVQNWFKLYGYPDEATALNGKLDPTDLTKFLVPPLRSAENLADLLGLSYQELTDLVTTGFLNPALYPLIFQFQRFGISMSDAFSYTGQPGYSALSAQAKTAFESLLDGITARYKKGNPASTFNARTWLTGLLPANYSQKVLVLADPNSGCNFTRTTLQYADNTSPATALDFLKLNLFVRLWKKLGWSMDETDRALQLFFPSTLPAWGDPVFAAAFSTSWKTALVYLAHLDDLNTRLMPALGRVALLPFWSNLPVQGAIEGTNPLYAQLFLTPSVLNNDWGFNDPAGGFPWSTADPLSAHQAAVQGVLGLTADEVSAIFADADAATTKMTIVINGQSVQVPSFSLQNLSVCYRYSLLAKCLQLAVKDMIALKVMSGLDPFKLLNGSPLTVRADDILLNQTLLFVQKVAAAQNSGFTVEDLKYLLRHQFDPVGKYQADPNALMALVLAVAGGLRQIQSQHAVPPNLMTLPESLIDQSLSGLVPATILKTLFTLLTNAQTITAAQGGVTPAGKIDPAPFAQEPELNFTYDAVTQTQTVSFQGLLLDWKKTQLRQINNSALFSGLLDTLQQQAQAALARSIGDLLGVWSSLMEYEAVETGVLAGLTAAPLTRQDAALSLSYDQADKLQWLAYRGVLTDAKKSALTMINNSATLLALLNDVQEQAMPAYSAVTGTLLAMWVNGQSYQAAQNAVTPADHVDPAAFAAALVLAQQAGTITAPVPQMQWSYDAVAQVQTLTCAGILTDALRTQLAALIPASTVLANLLQAVRNQAVQLFQTLAANLLTVAAADLDSYAQQFLGADKAGQQKLAKAELVSVFLPLLAQKLSRQFVLQTLSANLASDPSLTEALATDAALLNDPSNPGKALLGAFLAIGTEGVSAAYYPTPDESGPPQASGIAATTDTADPTNNKPGTSSAHFEGYMQVSTDGPYRFFAELGNLNAKVTFQLDPPDPTALLTNPIIQAIAGKDGDEADQFVQLMGGAAYHFTLDFESLGAQGARLLIQGETLPKGPLSQVVLYPQQTVDEFTRAKILLSKVLQILEVTELDEREISYLAANAAQFNNLKLSALPTQPGDDSPAKAVTLFSQFLTLADYADLRKGPAGGSDGLIAVFDNVGQTFTETVASQDANNDADAPWTSLANLTRRDAATVRAVAIYFSLIKEQIVGGNRQVTATGDFGNNKGIRRIWQALQLLQIAGVPTAPLTAATLIAAQAPPAGSPAPSVIAANLGNAVQAQYTTATWLPIAQSVFDKLRQKKRDALVAYLVQNLGLRNSNQLFEYFLVDPGMEPVVQTSRLRLAMSSVQTFIQRCLLNLENGNANQPARNVAPNAIDATWWEWMKRYRVWQANREIFLFPENWMQPELRVDRTDLFQTLESTLLQGDVTSSLVEDAFLTYLKGLDARARLDIVATYLDQDMANPGISTLYVLGRTYGHPHKYFYRTYSTGTWSAWQAVDPDIESNHIVMAVWKGRLNVFWVNITPKAQKPKTPQNDPTGQSASTLSLSDLTGGIEGSGPRQQIQVQLNWSEYFQGKWSDRIATDMNRYAPIDVFDGFDPDKNAFVHVSKEVDSSGNEGAVRIHLDLNLGGGFDARAFRVTSKNCDPDFGFQYWQPAPSEPYNAFSWDATMYTGSSNLTSSFWGVIASNGQSTWETEKILDTVNNYAVLMCANPVAPPFLDPSDPDYWDAGGLVSPFFYKDTPHPSTTNELTFFVQPSLTETTIVEWEGWAIAPAAPAHTWDDPALFDNLPIHAQVPVAGPVPIGPGDPVYSIFSVQPVNDWVASEKTIVSYGGTSIGKSGGVTVPNINAVSSRSPLQTVTFAGAVGELTLMGEHGLQQGANVRLAPANNVQTRKENL